MYRVFGISREKSSTLVSRLLFIGSISREECESSHVPEGVMWHHLPTALIPLARLQCWLRLHREIRAAISSEAPSENLTGPISSRGRQTVGHRIRSTASPLRSALSMMILYFEGRRSLLRRSRTAIPGGIVSLSVSNLREKKVRKKASRYASITFISVPF